MTIVVDSCTSDLNPMEILTVPDPAARFALHKSRQADIVYNLPWALAQCGEP